MDTQQAPGGEITPDPGSDYLITVQIEPRFEDKVDTDRLHRLAIDVLRAERVPGPLELGVVITTDEEVHTLNRDFLGHDFDTDVLSFGIVDSSQRSRPESRASELKNQNSKFIIPPDRSAYLGDIAISYDRAAEQAPDYGQTADSEVATLLVHGILHLLGYDDTSDADRDRMHTRQRELLEALFEP